MKTLLLATVAMACSVVAAKAEDGFSFGLYGGATLGTETDHQLFGPNESNSATSSLDEGTWAGMDFRYHSNGAFFGLGIESINIDQSILWNGSGTPSGAGIDATIFDLEYGRHVNDNGYWTVGLRHMKLDLTSKIFFNGNGPLHAFEGTGVRIGYEGKQDNAIGGVSLLGGVGLSVLDGVIKTHDTDIWDCSDCTPTDTTAVGIDARISAAFQTSESGSIVVGYQAQHWKDVTVEISDDSGFGLNLGTSDILVHGPFIGFNTTF